MATYIALLRGINVGGARKLSMSDLRALFETLGHSEVRTYIQSGNVVFTAKGGARPRVRAAIEQGIEHDFGLDVTVVLRTPTELVSALARNPYGEDSHIAFLEASPASARITEITAIDPMTYAPDEFVVSDREVFVRYPNGAGRSKLNNAFFERKLATRATARNLRTVSTLHDWATS